MVDCTCDSERKNYVGNVGTDIIVDVCATITSATVVKFVVKKPDDTVVEWVGEIEGTTSIKYVTKQGDLNLAGRYRLQAHVTMPGWSGYGDTGQFVVYDVFS